MVLGLNTYYQRQWEVANGKEGPYLDLWLSLENGKIQSKVYTKSEPIYLHPSSCHDPAVFKGLVSGVARRLRLNCSKDSDFEEAAEHYARAFAISGHSYAKSLKTLMEAKKIDRLSSPPELTRISKSNEAEAWQGYPSTSSGTIASYGLTQPPSSLSSSLAPSCLGDRR